jgi:hypothetical protein
MSGGRYRLPGASIRPILAAFFFLVPVFSLASEAMIYGLVYECDAEEINRDMVEMCSSRFPDLSREANDALSAWRDRNLEKADAKGDLQAFRTLIANTKTEIRSGFQDKIEKDGMAPCLDAFRQLKTSRGPLDIR